MRVGMPRGAVRPNHPLYIARKDTMDTIIHWAEESKNGLVTGPYMTGKTSILLDVCEELRKLGKTVALIDLTIHIQEEYPRMLKSIFDEITEAISQSDKRVPDNGNYGNINSGIDFGKAILELALKRPLVIILDEFHRLKENGTFFKLAYILRWTTERAKRNPYDEVKGLSVIISGVIDLVDMFSPAQTSPFNTLEYILLPDLTREEVRSFLSRSGTICPEGIEIPNDSFEHIFRETGGHPVLVQMFASKLRGILGEGKQIPWDEDGIEEIAEIVSREFSFDFDIVLEKLESHVAVQELIQRLLNGEKIPYSTWHMDVRHARLIGVIRENEVGFCQIRSGIYERIIKSEGWEQILP